MSIPQLGNVEANTAFQYFVDRATNLSFNRKPIVATTVARSGMTRAVSRGNRIWRFDVTVPDGLRYSDIRNELTLIDRYAQFTDIDISFDKADYLFKYQGNLTSPNRNFTAIATGLGPEILSISQTPGVIIAKVGDLVKVKGRVYSVIRSDGDTISGTTQLTVHRPLIGVTNFESVSCTAGEQVTFPVRAIQIPTFTLFGFDQVAWNGSFQFIERF
jgi:hypothetical protein